MTDRMLPTLSMFETAVRLDRIKTAGGPQLPLRRFVMRLIACLAPACTFLATPATAQGTTFDCLMDPSLTLKLGSPITNVLSRVEVDRGDFVKKGQVIAQLESAVEEAAVAVNEARAASTAEIEAKQAVMDLKQGVLGRKKKLILTAAATEQDVETAQAEFNVAQQDVASAKLNRRMAELELNRSRADLELRTIRSPIDGIVIKRTLGPGEYVYQEANIVTVAKIDPLFVETFLPVAYYGQIKVGDKAHVRPNDPVGGDYEAAVKVVDQVFDAASGTFGIRLALANPEHIVPGGLRCRITFDVPEQTADLPPIPSLPLAVSNVRSER